MSPRLGIGGLEHRVADAAQIRAQQLANILVVVHDKEIFGHGAGARRAAVGLDLEGAWAPRLRQV